MHLRNAIILIALCAAFMKASGQNALKDDARSVALGCPAAKDLANTDVFGTWVMELHTGTGW